MDGREFALMVIDIISYKAADVCAKVSPVYPVV